MRLGGVSREIVGQEAMLLPRRQQTAVYGR